MHPESENVGFRWNGLWGRLGGRMDGKLAWMTRKQKQRVFDSMIDLIRTTYKFKFDSMIEQLNLHTTSMVRSVFF